MSAWPMQGRNKIIDSKIEESIKSTVEKEENAEAREAADQVGSNSIASISRRVD